MRLAHDPARRDDLLSHAWELVERHHDALVRADDPWPYLKTCLRHSLLSLIMADALQVSPTAVRNGTAARTGIQSPVRMGGATLLDDDEHWPTGVALNTDGGGRGVWDDGLVGLHAELVGCGATSTTTAEAIDRIIDIAATTRRGHRESAVADDVVLRRLGLTPRQAQALLALLIGSRLDSGRSSLWLEHRTGKAPHQSGHALAVDRRIAAYITPFASISAKAA